MTKAPDRANLVQILLFALGITFTVFQGFTAYYTQRVDNSLTKLEDKLDKTWDITLVTQARVVQLEANQSRMEDELKKVREDYLRLRSNPLRPHH